MSFHAQATTPCESELLYFRGAENFSEVDHGFYVVKGGQLYFSKDTQADDEMDIASMVLVNSAAHREILRRQLGADRFHEIFGPSESPSKLQNALKDELRKSESPSHLLDAEQIKDEVEKVPHSNPISFELEEKVFDVFEQMGRLASPMSGWLYPKLANKKLYQLPADQMDDPISTYIRPGVYVYKAIMVTARLKGERTFIMGAGKSGLPDSIHQLLIEALRMTIPAERVLKIIPGYIVITPNSPAKNTSGKIEFLPKGHHKRPLAIESFNFQLP